LASSGRRPDLVFNAGHVVLPVPHAARKAALEVVVLVVAVRAWLFLNCCASADVIHDVDVVLSVADAPGNASLKHGIFQVAMHAWHVICGRPGIEVVDSPNVAHALAKRAVRVNVP